MSIKNLNIVALQTSFCTVSCYNRLFGWLVDLFYGVSFLFGLFSAELNFRQFSLFFCLHSYVLKQFSSMSKQFYFK